MSLFNRIAAVSALSISLAIAGPASANLIQNGSFENDSVTPGTWKQFSDIDGWEAGNDRFEIWNNYGGETAQDGNQFAELNAHPGNGSAFSLFQDITTVAGQSYVFSFAYQARANSDEEFSFTATPSGSTTWVLNDHTTSGWSTFSDSFIAGDATTRITFTSVIPSTGTVGNFLDNVEVTAAVPEPGTLGLLGAGLLGLVAARRRRA